MLPLRFVSENSLPGELECKRSANNGHLLDGSAASLLWKKPAGLKGPEENLGLAKTVWRFLVSPASRDPVKPRCRQKETFSAPPEVADERLLIGILRKAEEVFRFSMETNESLNAVS